MGDRVFKRGKIWFAWIPDGRGGLRRETTRCTSKPAALIVQQQRELEVLDPAYAASNEATTSRIATDYFDSRKRLGRAEGTLHHVKTKAGHLVRLLPTMAKDITPRATDAYVDQRLKEGARRTTIKKELRVLKAALKLGSRNSLWRGDLASVLPELEDDYEPRTRFLTPREFVGLIWALRCDDRAAMVAFIVATGARWGEAQRWREGDVVAREGVVFVPLRGTKTRKSRREVPVLGAGMSILRWAMEHAGDRFPAWGNVRRDLRAACARIGVPPVSPNDLRRTFSTWLQQAGAGNDLVAQALGHVDSRMVERVYGQMSSDDLARLIAQRTQFGPLMGSSGGQTGPLGGSPDNASPGKNCAQGRNRTADTGIFRPSGLPLLPDGSTELVLRWDANGLPLGRRFHIDGARVVQVAS